MAQLLSFLSRGDSTPIQQEFLRKQVLSSGPTRTRASDSYPTDILRGIQPWTRGRHHTLAGLDTSP